MSAADLPERPLSDQTDRTHAEQPEEQPVQQPAPTRRRSAAFVLRSAVFIVFGLFYAYDLFEAVANLLGVNAQLNAYNLAASAVGLSKVSVPWAVLISNVALAPVAFLAAVLVAHKRPTGIVALVLLAGLAVVAALTLTFSALV